MLIIYMYICAVIAVPSSMVLFEGEGLNLKILKGLTVTWKNSYETALTSTTLGEKVTDNIGTKTVNLELFNKITLKQIDVDVIKKTTVIPLGNAIGMKLYTKGVLVVGMTQINTDDGKNVKPYENSGIEEGDTIIAINDENVENTEELIRELNNSNGEEVNIKYVKDDKVMQTSIKPVKSENMYKIGLWVRDTQAGVGTATFYEPDTNQFMTLGHGITDIDTGQVVTIANGELQIANIISIVKGKKGEPGEILGTIENDKTIGKIDENTAFGVYGEVTNNSYLNIDTSKEMEIASRNEIKEGKAEILCQLDNSGVKSYEIEIEKIYINNNENNKSMLIKVTDEKLLDITGGIIQGMSGSPVIQDGKFVGAITSVLVNNPAEGYAVFGDILIKQMREAV